MDDGGYHNRVDAPIFDNTGNLSSYIGGPAAGQLLWANDFSFAGSAWAGATGRHPTTFSLIVFNLAAATQAVRFRVQIYTGAHFSYNGTGAWGTRMDDPTTGTGEPIFDQIYISPAFVQNTGNFVIGNFPTTFTFPNGTDQFFVKWSFLDINATDTTPAPAGTATWGFSTSPGATPTNAASPGTDLIDFGRDQNASGILDGGAVGTGALEHRTILSGANAASPSWQVSYAPAVVVPTPTFNFNCLADGTTTRAVDSIGANQLAWYKFCLNSDATDTAVAGTNGHFVDMHTHGSNFDTVIALYDTAGNLLWTADDDGTDLQSMLSFGMGRRPAIGGGLERDGFGFVTGPGLAAAPGPYYLAVPASALPSRTHSFTRARGPAAPSRSALRPTRTAPLGRVGHPTPGSGRGRDRLPRNAAPRRRDRHGRESALAEVQPLPHH